MMMIDFNKTVEQNNPLTVVELESERSEVEMAIFLIKIALAILIFTIIFCFTNNNVTLLVEDIFIVSFTGLVGLWLLLDKLTWYNYDFDDCSKNACKRLNTCSYHEVKKYVQKVHCLNRNVCKGEYMALKNLSGKLDCKRKVKKISDEIKNKPFKPLYTEL